MRQPKAKHSKYKLIEGKTFAEYWNLLTRFYFSFRGLGALLISNLVVFTDESFALNEKHVLTEYEEKDWNGSSSKAVNEPVNEVSLTQDYF